MPMRNAGRLLLLVFACTTAMSCFRGAAAPPGKANSAKRSAVSPSRKSPQWTILSRGDLSKQFGKDFEKQTWQPSKADVSSALERVWPHLEELRRASSWKIKREKTAAVLSKPDDYYVCQAYGITRYGQKVITLSFFPRQKIAKLKDHGSDWQHALIKAKEGGADYWEIDYDPDSTVLSRFVANPVPGETPEPRWAILAKVDNSEFKGVWQPTEAQVRQSLKGVHSHLGKLKTTTSWKWEQEKIGEILVGWDKYVCQAVGYTVNGKKRIHLNYFPEYETDGIHADNTDWRRDYMTVFDGGADFWRVDYDCETGDYEDFSCNGDA
jgi:hypothetical protein